MSSTVTPCTIGNHGQYLFATFLDTFRFCPEACVPDIGPGIRSFTRAVRISESAFLVWQSSRGASVLRWLLQWLAGHMGSAYERLSLTDSLADFDIVFCVFYLFTQLIGGDTEACSAAEIVRPLWSGRVTEIGWLSLAHGKLLSDFPTCDVFVDCRKHINHLLC